MNKQQKDQYLADPRHCPFCGSSSLSSSNTFTGEGDFGDPTKLYVFMECDGCGEYWNDVYKLVGVQTQTELEAEING